MNDKRIRQLVIAILGVILILGLLSLVSTVFQMIVPLAILAVGAIAFYKIVLQGRDKPAAMEDEIAETAGIVAEDFGASARATTRVSTAKRRRRSGSAQSKRRETNMWTVHRPRKKYSIR